MKKNLISVSQKERFQGQLDFLDMVGSIENYFIEDSLKELVVKNNSLEVIFIIPKKSFNFLYLKSKLYKKLDELGEFDSIIVNSDRTLNLDLLLCNYGNTRQIKLIIPFLTVSLKESLIEIRRRNPKKFKVNNYFKKIICSLINKNIIRDSNNYYCFYTPKNIIKILYWRININNSWNLGDNYSPEIQVASKYSKELSIKQGINSNLIKIKKSINFNKIVGLKDNKIQYDVCFSYTPYHEHKLLSKIKSTTVQLKYLNEIKSNGYKVIISLHPKCDIKFYSNFFKDFEIRVGRTEDCIIESKLVIAFYSSILLWAVFSNKPFLVLDPFDFNYNFLEEMIEKKNIIKNKEHLLLKLKMNLNSKTDFQEHSNKFLGFNINNYNQILN
ncbi:hypothetical protein N9H82_05805 [Flavobacteriaceae bacterium]|nr:hypothetical protein [Flavobacteriaceae bacterium]